MWQFERAPTDSSSGSTAAFTAHLPTTCGDADAGTGSTVKTQGMTSTIAVFGKLSKRD